MNTDDADQGIVSITLEAGRVKHFDLTEKIIGVFYDVYNEVGHGFLESVCESAMGIGLTDAGLKVQSQVPIQVWFRGRPVVLSSRTCWLRVL